ncbi:MAG TPA: adenylate/guanylate cyclase domain-containing protein [Solirubrobacteraceae bacterium]|nr:adenylate/guanylate cyclase domain-containing protein [Solirubrobacteraceae bacterium]
MGDVEPPRPGKVRQAASRTDADPRVIGMLRALRRRLPGDERYGDPLSTAGEEPVNVIARRMSALTPERPSAVGELGLGALQAWQALSEKSGRGLGDEELALLFTDLVGFSSWALEAGDAAAVELLREVGVVVEGAVAEHGGRIVKRLGDGVMAVFSEPQDAVAAALSMHPRLDEIVVAGHTPRMRAGVHCGRPRKLGGDYLGVDVNVAARVGEAAGAAEVLVSQPAADRLDAERFDVGRAKRLKASGAPRELRVSSVTARRP